MKRFIYLVIVIAFIACKGNENKQPQSSNDSIKKDSVRTEYTCPMHPEIVTDKPGKCPRCGMDLEPKS
jgi:hypothetical protein